MKNLMFTLALSCVFGFSAVAQEEVKENPTEEAQEKIQQEPPRETQRIVENANRNDIQSDRLDKKQAELERQKAIRQKVNDKSAKPKKDRNRTR